MNKYLYAFCVIFVTHVAEANRLKKIYVHHAPMESTLQDTPQLELTKASLHFAERPVVHQLAHNAQEQNGWKHEIHFFIIDGLESVCKKSIPNMQKATDHYRIACTEVSEPRKGLRVEICYDPQYIMCVRESFDAITSDKGVVFRLINKKLLDDMCKTEKPLLQTACTKMPHIVIDFGHGGYDPGAIGLNGLVEKDITLQVGRKLAHLLREKGCLVFLTREADNFVSLTQRSHIINTYRPDAYISVHANSSLSSTVQGIEIYCLSSGVFSDFTCADSSASLFQRLAEQRYAKSRLLADHVHARTLTNLTAFSTRDRRIKHGVSQVLLGANVPGILVEIGFVTHHEEALRLVRTDYQECLARGMCDGLMAYLNA